MKHILVTGSNGQLGSEIKEISNYHSDHHFIFTDKNELDITIPSEIYNFFSTQTIDFVINCAAYTNVDKAESDKKNAQLVNIKAVKNLVNISEKFKTKLLHISTDYVFDGNGTKPYREDTLTNPQSVYGITKLEGEKHISNSSIDAITIRTSWLYSSFGANFVKTMLKLGKERNELNVVFDQLGSPTYAKDLATAILNIIINKEFIPGIYHYSNEGICSWFDFAKEIMTIKNLSCRINPIETKDYPTAAKRPAYSAIDKSKIIDTFNISIPKWKVSLKKCLEIID